MKKVLLSIIMLIYLAVSSGVAMEIHYCMGERAGADLYGHGDDKCGRCGMVEKKDGCCSDELKFYKLSDEHQTVSTHQIDVLNFAVLNGIEIPSPDLCIERKVFRVIADPPDDGPPLYISNCVFRI